MPGFPANAVSVFGWAIKERGQSRAQRVASLRSWHFRRAKVAQIRQIGLLAQGRADPSTGGTSWTVDTVPQARAPDEPSLTVAIGLGANGEAGKSLLVCV